MIKFRRSFKSDHRSASSTSTTHTLSVPPKDPIAIVPPKKVIKALFDYQAPANSTGFLSFSQGDFLHVVARENDTEWYEACNPLIGSRGLVPVGYFEIVNKQIRNSAGSCCSNYSKVNAPHDSAYAEKVSTLNSKPKTNSTSVSSSTRSSAGMIYGVVLYDFKAERSDELEAREGESVIVIAQSNPEWFVAKPITRLGGPGLIPVAFIEIRDMATGLPVSDPQAAIRRANIPRVEEWKKMAAEYKNGSIPLGKLQDNPLASSQSPDRSSSSFRFANGASSSYNSRSNILTTAPLLGRPRLSSTHLLAPINASVPRYCYADDTYWFIVECRMEDGRDWLLSRLYQDFYDLQINLIKEFPLEAGQVPGVERSLPYMPGPVTVVTDNISKGRRYNLNEYIRKLLLLGPHITRGYLVRRFFAPRQGDCEGTLEEIDTTMVSSCNGSRHSRDVDYPPSFPHQTAAPPMECQELSRTDSISSSHRREQSSSTAVSSSRIHSDGSGPPSVSSLNNQGTDSLVTSRSLVTAPNNGPSIKIKVWFETDNCLIIRMPPVFDYHDLCKKLKERRCLERLDKGRDISSDGNSDLRIEYKDDSTGQMHAIGNDQDLQQAIERCAKLTLSVTPTG